MVKPKNNKKDIFVGRKKELDQLRSLAYKKHASLIVITGRRRVGKSRLIEEFAKDRNFYNFTGLAPTDKTSGQDQLDEFAKQMAKHFNMPPLKTDDWGDLFNFLGQKVKKQKSIILLDEISWMGSKDPNFLGKLKIAWDTVLSKNPQLILVLCGSVSSWISKNIISSSNFLGRISLKINLEELSIIEASELMDKLGFKISSQEKFRYLSLIGGVPWYLQLLNPSLTLNANIQELCFTKNGILVDEFDHIFYDLFGKRSDIYTKIANALSKANLSSSELAVLISYSDGGTLSEYLEDLVKSRFISQEDMWSFESKKTAKSRRFRLSDSYLRFYFRSIRPNLSKINRNQFASVSPDTFSNWHSVLGLQFENLILNNRNLIIRDLKINPQDVVMDGPYFQSQTKRHQGCQIDYLIQTKFKALYLCEIKFSSTCIENKIIFELEKKISKLQIPRGFAVNPVLIYSAELSDALMDSDYFTKIIDASSLL